MPIKIPAALPAYSVLEREGVMVIPEDLALRQDIRPLQIALLNLMPKKVQTETQFARLIGAGPLQIELTLIRMSAHESRHTPSEHLKAFYRRFEEMKDRKFDGLIITGAPIEHLDYTDVSYWDELREVFEWTRRNIHSTLAVCWGAQAMLRYFYQIEKHDLGQKLFGCYEQELTTVSPFTTGFADQFCVPVSRWTEVREEDVTPHGVEVLAKSGKSGLCLLRDESLNALYMFNHLEYDADTLAQEFERDRAANPDFPPPVNYFPGDDPARAPRNRWRSHGHLLLRNWITQLYESTPFDIRKIGES